MRWLLILVAIIVTIAFVWLYNAFDPAEARRSYVGEAYGREVTRLEFRRYARLFDLSRDLGMFDFLTPLAYGPYDEPQQNFAVNLIVLHQIARDMNLQPTEAQIRESLQRFPAFRGPDGTFDQTSFALFLEQALSPRGLSMRNVEELASAAWMMRAISDLHAATITPLEPEVNLSHLRRRSLHQVQLVEIPRETFAQADEPSEEEIVARYEAMAGSLLTEARYRVMIATATLSEEAQGLEGPEKIQALQALSYEITDKNIAALENPERFESLSQAAGYNLEESEWFTSGELIPQLSGLQGVERSLQRVRTEDPISDVYQRGDEFVMFKLVEFEEPRPLTLEEAREDVLSVLLQESETRNLRAKAAEIREEFVESLEGGQSFEEIAAERELEVTTIAPFSFDPPPTNVAHANVVLTAAVDLPVGEVSQAELTPTGAVIAYVKDRQAPSEAAFEEARVGIRTDLERNMQLGGILELFRLERERGRVQLYVVREIQ